MAERPGGHSPCLQENRLVWGRFPFCDHARPPDSGWVPCCHGGATPCLPLCCVASILVRPSLGLGAEPALLSRAAAARPAGLPSPGEVLRRRVSPLFQHLPHGGLAAAPAAPWDLLAPPALSASPFSASLSAGIHSSESSSALSRQEALWAPKFIVLGSSCLVLRSCSAL